MSEKKKPRTFARRRALYQEIRKRRDSTVACDVLARAGSFTPASFETYIRKNMLAPWVTLDDSGNCVVDSLDEFYFADVLRGLSQKKNLFAYDHLGCSPLVSSLLERARVNASLATELINRPELANRLDAFVLLFVTAWEQLLKAELERDTPESIFTGRTSSIGRPITIGISICMERAFSSSKDPVRRNLEYLKYLRDGAAHLIVPETTGIVTRYFQAGLLNFVDRFSKIAFEPPFRLSGSGLLTLGTTYQKPSIEALRLRVGDQASEVDALITRLEKDAKSTSSPQFAVDIEYKLVLDKKPGAAAIHLSKDPDGLEAQPIFVPKDPETSHPHMTKDCAKILKSRTGYDGWTTNDVAAVASLLKVKKDNNQYHYLYKHGRTELRKYSDLFIDRVVQRFEQDKNLIRKAYKARRQQTN